MPRRCLIAETDPFIASLLSRFAEGSGLECISFSPGDDVLELAQQLKPDILIIDDELPGELLGWEVIRALQANEATRPIAVISCSWLSEADMRSLVDGVVGHLQKPDLHYSDFERILQAAGFLEIEEAAVEPPPPQSGKSDPASIDSQHHWEMP